MGNSTINKAIAAAIAAGLAAPGAHAGTILTDNLSLSQLLASPGSSYSGTFSIGSLLSENSLSGATISDATVTAYGYSDAVASQSTASSSETLLSSYSTYVIIGYSYSCGWGGCSYAPEYGYALYDTYLYTYTKTNTDTVADTMTIQSGTDSGSGTVADQPPTTVDGPEEYIGTAANSTYGHDTYYGQADTVTQGYYGSLAASATLGSPELNQLGLTDSLSFTVTDTVGQMNLTGAVLTFTADASAPSSVPEPGSAALLGAGLLSLAALAQARRRGWKRKA